MRKTVLLLAVIAMIGATGSTTMAKTESPIRNAENKFVTLETNMGKMTLELYRDVAPAHADSFVSLTKKKFYDGTIFHRIIDGFMIQGGDPTGTGTGNAGYMLPAEFNKLPHLDGTLSMARSADPNSASCQFFICLGKVPHLDGKYTVFGQLVNGFEILRKIGKTPVGPGNGGERSKPLTEVKILKAYLSDADGAPIEEAPKE
ncbi:MAG: peptidylprolyl isomerase [candidate division Zixibacteria bacterium]|nr:peptidylprolyl isomerase [candidate division Zixibacteria bacterium]